MAKNAFVAEVSFNNKYLGSNHQKCQAHLTLVSGFGT